MGKGLLRKALHGAATSASGMLANKIEEKRQTRLMDYEAMRQRENQDYRFGQEKEMFEMEVGAQGARDDLGFERSKEITGIERQNRLDEEALRLQNQRTLSQEDAARRTQEAELAYQRGIQSDVFRSGLDREETAAQIELELNAAREEARLAAEAKGIELTDVKFTVPDSMGNPTPVTMSAHIDRDTGVVRLFDNATGEFVSAREAAAQNAVYETLAKAEQWLPQVLENDKDLEGFQESVQSWRQAMGDTPIPEVYTRQLPQEFQDYLKSEPAPATAQGTQPRQPAADPLAPFEGRAVQPGLISRATTALSNAASTVGMAQVTSGGETESIKQNAKWLLENHLSRGTLPERTLMSRPRIESALRSDLLSDEDKTMLRRYLEQD